MQNLSDFISKNIAHFIKLRHTMHANPELAFEEQQTAALVAHELQVMGLEVTMGVAVSGSRFINW